jgi:hypothetical protein
MARFSRRSFLLSLSALALSLLSTRALGRVRGTPQISQFNNRKVQLNAAGAGYNTCLNAFLSAGRWYNVSAPGAFDITRLDTDGYPTTLPAGGAQVDVNLPADANVSSWKLLWDGTGTLGSSGALISGSYSISGCVVDFSFSGVNTATIQILATNSAPNNVRNVRLVANNGRDEALLSAGQIFRPEYLAIIQYAGILRDLDVTFSSINTLVNWADRKPVSYYSYGQNHFPPSKVVPAANITYSSPNYSVTWSGQTGPLTDKTQFIGIVPTTQTVYPSYVNLNGTGNYPIAGRDGTVRASSGIANDRWMTFTFDADLACWMVDDSQGTRGTGIITGAPPEFMIAMANAVGAHLWVVPSAYQCDYGTNNASVSDYISNYATLIRNTLNPNLQAIHECGPNETWNDLTFVTAYADKKQLFRNGGSSAYTVTAATSGATTRLTIGPNTTQVGSLLIGASIGGLSGASGNCRVLSKPNSNDVVVNYNSTGTYTSGGTLTPVNFDRNNWYGLVASNVAQVIASVYGIGQKGIRYRTIAGFQGFGLAGSVGSNSGQSARIESPFLTFSGGSAAYNWLTGISPANYFGPGYYPGSSTNNTIIEMQLAYEYTTASAARKTAILDEYANSATLSTTPVTISNITPGNPTVITVDRTDLFVIRDLDGGLSPVERTSLTGITGNIGTVLNRSTYNSPNFGVLSKTANTVTIDANTTGLVYSGGGVMTTRCSLSFGLNNFYTNVLPLFLTYTSTYGLELMPYEGGLSSDRMVSNCSASIKGITNAASAVLNVGANPWDYLYNTVGLSGFSVQISGIAAGTLATLLNGNTYTITAATPTTITINVDTSAVSAWVSGGLALLVGSQSAMDALRNNVNFTPAAQTVTVQNYNMFTALNAACKFPSEYVILGQQNYAMYSPDFYPGTLTPYRALGMFSWS